MEFHAAASLFPLLEGQEFKVFKEDVRLRGQQEPIVVWQGQGLDGRNRLRACEELGLTPWIEEVSEDTDPIAYVLSANLHRRHLDESRRAMVGAKAKGMYEAEAKERQKEGQKRGGQAAGRGRPKEGDSSFANLQTSYEPVHSGKKAAEAVNVSPRSVESASKVIANGTSELNRLVESGEVSVSAAATVAHLPIPEQEEVVSRGPEAIRTRAKEVRESVPPMPPEDREAEQKAERGQRWHKCIHDLWSLLNSVRDVGGIERLMKKWDQAGQRKILADLRKISGVLQSWIAALEKEE